MAGFSSVAPFGGTMLTSRSRADWAASVPPERPLTAALLPPPRVTSTATPAMTASPTRTAPAAIKKGLLDGGEPEGSLLRRQPIAHV